MTERSKVIDCKSIGCTPRRFESGSPHIFIEFEKFILKPEYRTITFIFDESFFSINVCLFLPFNNFYRNRRLSSLNITFNFRKVLLNLSTFKKKTILFLTPGLFFWKLKLKKSQKRSLKVKTLQFRFLKKFLTLLSINKILLKLFKKIKNYKFFLNLITKPINHFFKDPFNDEKIILKKLSSPLNIKYVYFIKQISFYELKKKKKVNKKKKFIKN